MERPAVCGGSNLPLGNSGVSRSLHLPLSGSKQEFQRSNFSHARVSSSIFSLPASAIGIPKLSLRNSIPDGDSDSDEDVKLRTIYLRKKLRKRPWWSAYKPPSLVDEEGDGKLEKALEILGNLWIIKVFKAFGFALPPIILSCLIAGGPKALLMAFALALGLSAIAYAFERLYMASALADSMMVPEKHFLQKNKASKSSIKSDEIGGNRADGKKSESKFGGWDRLNLIELKESAFEVDNLSLDTSSAVIIRSGRDRNQVLVLICLLVTILPLCNFLV